jgi:hypothetical protein
MHISHSIESNTSALWSSAAVSNQHPIKEQQEGHQHNSNNNTH